MMVLYLSKQQALDADRNAIQQINFNVNLDRAGNGRIDFIFEEAKAAVLDFWQGTVKVLWNAIKWFNFYQHKMSQYDSLNVTLSNSQLNKLKSAIKNEAEVVLRPSSNMVGNSNDEANFPINYY